MRRAAAVILVGVLALAGLVVATATPAAANASIESAFVSKINSLRASKGLRQLAVDGELTNIGRAWSQQMANAGQISHNPNFPGQVTSNWAKLGENVGRGGEIDSLFQAFVNSPAHYANLVDPAFTHVGVGVVVSGGTIWTSHQFMQLRGAPAPTAAPAPAPAPTAAASPAPKAPRAPSPAPSAATSAPRAQSSSPAASGGTAAPAPPKPKPVPSLRVVLSLERLQGLAP